MVYSLDETHFEDLAYTRFMHRITKMEPRRPKVSHNRANVRNVSRA